MLRIMCCFCPSLRRLTRVVLGVHVHVVLGVHVPVWQAEWSSCNGGSSCKGARHSRAACRPTAQASARSREYGCWPTDCAERHALTSPTNCAERHALTSPSNHSRCLALVYLSHSTLNAGPCWSLVAVRPQLPRLPPFIILCSSMSKYIIRMLSKYGLRPKVPRPQHSAYRDPSNGTQSRWPTETLLAACRADGLQRP
jgi:hypothetical protein